MMPILPSALLKRERSKCPAKCGLCKKRCPAHLDIDGDTPLSGECICCHACEATCPRKNIQIGQEVEELKEEAAASWEEISIEEHMEIYEKKGMSRKDAMKQVAKDRGVSKRDIYSYLMK